MSNIVDLPIGVFDSGLGGLTVVAELQRRFPAENIIYLGDNARVPYGTRSPETIKKYAWKCSRFLVDKGLKMLVVACNTASAVAIDSLAEGLDIPVLGVISAGAKSALDGVKVQGGQHRRVGVIGTAGTIGSDAYPKKIGELDSSVDVYQNAAPLLVPLVEEGWIEGRVPELAVSKYLAPLIAQHIDVLLLGCTHYPVLRTIISNELKKRDSSALIVDSASSMADEAGRVLLQQDIARNSGSSGRFQCYSTDLPDSFSQVAGRFLGHSIGDVIKVDIT